MSPYLQRQVEFARMIPRLLDKATSLGFLVTLGEAYRTPAQAALNAAAGTGISNSLHTDRMAIDLNLYDADGNYLSGSGAHQLLGEYWESIGGSWGGRFSRPDGGHYSLAYGGRR